MKTITSKELLSKLRSDIGVHVWNATSDQYFKGEMIPGSRRVPVEKVADAIKGASLSKDAAIVVYCAGPMCPASKMAAEKLQGLGFTNVTAFEGGIKEWKEAGYEISTQACLDKKSCTTDQEMTSCSTGTGKSSCAA